jgi:hypothetical protein
MTLQRVISFSFLITCIGLLFQVELTAADTWRCVRPDGTEIFSDRMISEKCRKMEDLPPLMRAPAVPPVAPEEAKPEEPSPPPREAEQVPTPGRGRRIDPPGDAAISIQVLKATPNFNSLLGVAQYEATLFVENGDSNWTAEKVCVNVRFRDFNFIFLDVNQVGCLDNLRPVEGRTFPVVYTGMIPPRLFPIRAEATLAFVKWTK